MNDIDQVRPLLAVRELFQHYQRPYWVAGGWALDLYAGRVRRAHTDVDVLVLARDVDHLAATVGQGRPDVLYPETGERRPWQPGEILAPGPLTLVFPGDDSIQIMLAASEGDEWIYHRGRGTLRAALTDITLTTPDGLPYLAPEIVLLFKSRGMRPKDHQDFLDVLDLLDEPRRHWLAERTAPRYPDHPWIALLHQR